MAPAPVAPALLAAALLLSAGCGRSELDPELAAYRERVLAALDPDEVLAGPGEGPTAQPLPRRRLRTRTLEEARGVSLWEFLQLQDCRLGELAGYRNSQLGRVMAPPRRLAYELEVLDAVATCRDRMDPSLRERVDAAAALKRSQLPAATWNAVWLSPEVEGLLRLRAPASPLPVPGAAADAIEDLVVLVEHADARSWPQGWVPVFEALARHRAVVGERLRALDAQRRHLDAVAAALESARGSDVCERLSAARRTYVDALRDRIASTRSSAYALLEPMHRLYSVTAAGLDEVPAAMRAYASVHLDTAHEDSLYRAHRRAALRHEAGWAALACELTRGTT